MRSPTCRSIPLVVVASEDPAAAAALVAQLRNAGAAAYAAHGAQGCLRMATATAPDYVLLDGSIPSRIETLLKAHPTSAGASIAHTVDELLPVQRDWAPAHLGLSVAA